MLYDDDIISQEYAINHLLERVPIDWSIILEGIDRIKEISENEYFSKRKTVFFLLSKLYYYKNDYENAFSYILKYSELFSTDADDVFSKNILSIVFQKYISYRENGIDISPEHTIIIEKCLNNIKKKKNYSQLLLLSFELKRIDYVKDAIENDNSLKKLALELCLSNDYKQKFIQDLLRLLVKKEKEKESENEREREKGQLELADIYDILEDHESATEQILELVNSKNENDLLLAYQIAFDISDNSRRMFIKKIYKRIKASSIDEQIKDNLMNILNGRKKYEYYTKYLQSFNIKKYHVLINILKKKIDNKPYQLSVFLLFYSFLYLGTGNDGLFRKMVEDEKPTFADLKSTWYIYCIVSSVINIHFGRVSDIENIIGPWVNPNKTPVYIFSGSLFSYALLCGNRILDGKDKLMELTSEQVKKWEELLNSENEKDKDKEILLHGSVFFYAFAHLESHKSKIAEPIYNLLVKSSSSNNVRPEICKMAAIAMGLIYLGSANKDIYIKLYEIFKNSIEHDKISRGFAICFAFIFYGKGSDADECIEKLISSRSDIEREAAAYIISLANVGNGSSKALKRLLQTAVSDVNEEVRKAASIGVGFVLSRRPEEVPSMIKLLAHSHHRHVRMGSALAIGISCAGTGDKDVIEILKPLLTDNEDMVRQHAMISMAMVLQQQNEKKVPYVKEFREYLKNIIISNKKRTDKNTFELYIYGASQAFGILHASVGGSVLSCNSLKGRNSVTSTIALFLFCNYFYWISFSSALSLALHPTTIIGVNKDLEIVSKLENTKISTNEESNKGSNGEPTIENKLYSGDNDWDLLFKNIDLYDPDEIVFEQEEKKPAKLSVSKEVEMVEQEIICEKKEEEIRHFPVRVTPEQLHDVEQINDSEYEPISGKLSLGILLLKKK